MPRGSLSCFIKLNEKKTKTKIQSILSAATVIGQIGFYIYCCVFEIVKASVIENEPTAFPGLITATLFPQPALFDRIEKSQHKIVSVVNRYFERFFLYVIVKFLRKRMKNSS
jgi:hypothetical protein